ncbi:alpha/beta-hydrolase [Pleurotus eryngii]|uniref:Alpha/beta-hydrolase n=1 Tax=Pleurotus eryngii TaxID=5323 RepID=A0A9P5ZLI0_PLEER|nr:alpha/beta-hydrolase [Pleurotus eryngii]
MSLRLSPFVFLFLSLLSFVFAATTSKIVTSADGTKIYADATGDPKKQSIVFVHGFALSGVVFDRFFANKRLANYYLVRYDMRGHGRSDKPATADAHTSIRYSQDFTAVMNGFGLKKPIFVGWYVPPSAIHKTPLLTLDSQESCGQPSYLAAIITDIVANNDVLPIAGAVALDGSPGINADIIPTIASPFLLNTLPAFNGNDDVTAALATRQSFVDGLFKDPAKVDFSIKAQYLGQTVVQPPAVSALVSMRPQDPTKLFAAGDAGKLPLQVLFGTSDRMVVADGVVSTFAPHFGNKLYVSKVDGGHALFDDNPEGMIDQLTWFVQKVTTGTSPRSIIYAREH